VYFNLKKIKMKKVIFLILVVSGLVIYSCDSTTYDEISAVTNPTYAKNIAPLMASKCTNCHSPNSSNDQQPYLNNYTEVKEQVENGDVLCIIDDPQQCFYSDIMPPEGRMPQATIDMINLWKDQGFQN
jgi:hypothetical protein